MNNSRSRNNFWNNFPLLSSLVMAACSFMYLGWLLDPSRNADNSFFNLVAPELNEIRNGRYLGLLTSSFFEPNILFFAWGIGWLWYFGKTVEPHVNIFFYLFLIISSIIFPELFNILIFEETGYGMGGTIYAVFGFMWFMSVYEPMTWSVTHTRKLLSIAFIFLCIVLDYTGIYKVAIGGLIGGFLWGVFVGFVSRLVNNKVLQISILTSVLAVFFIPTFWAPWQVSWLLNEAEKYEKQNKFEEAKELYSRVLKRKSGNTDGRDGLTRILNSEAKKHYEQKEYGKAKDILNRILEIAPDSQFAKNNLKLVLVGELADEANKYYEQKEYGKAKDILNRILDIEPDNELAKDLLINIPSNPK